MNNSIKAKELFRNDKEYVVMEGEVLIVDEHTGRMLAGRRYNDGLHQAIEAKEGVEVREEYQTLATDHAAELLPPLREALRHDRHGHDRGLGVRQDLQPRRRPDPDQQADGPRRPGRPRLPHRGGEVRRRRRRHRRAAREGPAGPGRHRLGREVRAPLRQAAQARHPAHRPQRQGARRRGEDRRAWPATRARSRSPPTWPVEAPTSCSVARSSSSPTRSCASRASSPPARPPRQYDAAWPTMVERIKEQVASRARRGARGRRPLRRRHRASRVAPHRQPAAWSFRPSGRPGRVPVLPVAAGRADAALQVRVGRPGAPGAEDPGRRPDREQAGHQRDRQRPGPGRVAELRVPQERPQVRRRDGPPAQGDLRRASRGPRGQGPRGADPRLPRRHRRPATSTAPPRSSPRSGTWTRCGPRCARSTRSSVDQEQLVEEAGGVEGLDREELDRDAQGRRQRGVRPARGGGRRAR